MFFSKITVPEYCHDNKADFWSSFHNLTAYDTRFACIKLANGIKANDTKHWKLFDDLAKQLRWYLPSIEENRLLTKSIPVCSRKHIGQDKIN